MVDRYERTKRKKKLYFLPRCFLVSVIVCSTLMVSTCSPCPQTSVCVGNDIIWGRFRSFAGEDTTRGTKCYSAFQGGRGDPSNDNMDRIYVQ
ncbi:hypothetical protein EYF80_053079 [Liparis tanakae]|uniref:Uncharacterized protein n=1 Tax=Liparis tanakae TaxID=230148 RepID=A0A4Z2F6G0_9TELE|nr:hypothetical protein EYF80_053079 [Liparis tanakae]